MESSCGASGNSKWGGAEIWKLLSDNHDLSVTHVGILSFEVFHFNAGAWEAEAGTFLRVLASSGHCLSYWSIAGKRHHDHFTYKRKCLNGGLLYRVSPESSWWEEWQQAYRYGAAVVAESSHLIPKLQEGSETRLGVGFWILKAQPQWYTSSHKTIPPNPKLSTDWELNIQINIWIWESHSHSNHHSYIGHSRSLCYSETCLKKTNQSKTKK